MFDLLTCQLDLFQAGKIEGLNLNRKENKMIRTKLAKKTLTKTEQKHLTKDAAINSMAAMKRQIEFMRKADPDSPASICRECFHIGRKLGLVK